MTSIEHKASTACVAAPVLSRSAAALLPIMPAVFIGFLVIGIAIPVLPLHVHEGLGLGTFLVGLVAGSRFRGGNSFAGMGRPGFGPQRRETCGRRGPHRGRDRCALRGTDRRILPALVRTCGNCAGRRVSPFQVNDRR